MRNPSTMHATNIKRAARLPGAATVVKYKDQKFLFSFVENGKPVLLWVCSNTGERLGYEHNGKI